MKFNLSQIVQLLEKIDNGQINALLLYGPDKGYIDKVCRTLVKKFHLLKTSIDYSDLKVISLEMLLNTKNFFMQKQLIKVRSVGESIDKSIKLALAKKTLHFVVFIADELPSSSSMRKFFEAENHLASLACFHDDQPKIAKIILQKCANTNKIIEDDAVKYLASCLKDDHQTILNEVDKLIYFTFGKDRITLNDAQIVVSDESMGTGDNLCMYFVQRNLDDFLREYTKLKQQNINDILIIRALIRYYLNLYTVLNKLKTGASIDEAIKSLSPPIFYKYVQSFKKAITQISLKNCTIALQYLHQAEVDYKLNSSSFDIYQQVYAKI